MNKAAYPFILLGGIVIFLIAFGSSMIVKLDPGERGVLFKPLSGGIDNENIYSQGYNYKAPWNDMIIYNVRQQEMTQTISALSSDGLEIALDLTLFFEVEKSKIGYLHEQVTPPYQTNFVEKVLRSIAYDVVGQYTPEQLYSTKKENVKNDIERLAATELSKKFVKLNAIMVRKITLPVTIKTAIEKKLRQEQESKEYEFKIIKETKEAERKRIEAQGIKDFQDIVSNGISEKYLKWKGIEATLDLSNSDNSKVIVIGGGDSGLPIILGNQ